MNEKVLKDFWRIVEQFPNIRNLSDLTRIIVQIEKGDDDSTEIYPNALQFLKDFQSIMHAHLYEENHVPDDEYSLQSGYENWSR